MGTQVSANVPLPTLWKRNQPCGNYCSNGEEGALQSQLATFALLISFAHCSEYLPLLLDFWVKALFLATVKIQVNHRRLFWSICTDYLWSVLCYRCSPWVKVGFWLPGGEMENILTREHKLSQVRLAKMLRVRKNRRGVVGLRREESGEAFWMWFVEPGLEVGQPHGSPKPHQHAGLYSARRELFYAQVGHIWIFWMLDLKFSLWSWLMVKTVAKQIGHALEPHWGVGTDCVLSGTVGRQPGGGEKSLGRSLKMWVLIWPLPFWPE